MKNKKAGIVAAVAVLICAAVFAVVKMNAKDPKEVVMEAFENVYTDDQKRPMEELFGLQAFSETYRKENSEVGLTVKLDSSSDASMEAFAGSGLRLTAESDLANNKSGVNAGVVYNGMDLASLNLYYGDETLMMSVPELSEKVFTIDLGEGLAQRLEESPIMGPALKESGADIEGFAAYVTELKEMEEKQIAEGKPALDIEGLLDRYQEGCKAQENLKAAMTVTKADKGTYTMDGKEVSCTGYQVLLSKASVIEFLRTSSDFFLQDEMFKEEFLKSLELSVRGSQLMGAALQDGAGLSVQEMQEQSYEEMRAQVDEMITFLDESWSDVNMTVYVDKQGRLAAVNGTTAIAAEDTVNPEESGAVDVAFDCQLQGGAYLTQNLTGTVTLTVDGEAIVVDIRKTGDYDGKQLSGELAVDVTVPQEDPINVTFKGDYNSTDGNYHAGMEVGQSGTQVMISAEGIVDQLEKGKSIHMTLDALEVSSTADGMNVVFSGEYYLKPLSAEIQVPEGTAFDMLAATEEDWNGLAMEMLFGVMALAGQIQMP